MNTCILGLYEKAQPDAIVLEEKLDNAARAGFDSFELSVDESDQRLARLAWGSAQTEALRAGCPACGHPGGHPVSERAPPVSARFG